MPACRSANTHSHTCKYLTYRWTAFRSAKHTHTHLWLAVVHSVRHTATSHTSSDSFCSLCVCVSAHTKALVNRIKVSLRSTTLSAHTPACLWRAAGSHAATLQSQQTTFIYCLSSEDVITTHSVEVKTKVSRHETEGMMSGSSMCEVMHPGVKVRDFAVKRVSNAVCQAGSEVRSEAGERHTVTEERRFHLSVWTCAFTW